MPETKFRVDHNPYGGAVNRFGPDSPILYWYERRTVIREYRGCAYTGGNPHNFRTQPTIQWMPHCMVGALRECPPHITPSIAYQDDRSGCASIGKYWDIIRRNRLKTAADE